LLIAFKKHGVRREEGKKERRKEGKKGVFLSFVGGGVPPVELVLRGRKQEQGTIFPPPGYESSLFPIPDSRFPIPNSRFPIPNPQEMLN